MCEPTWTQKYKRRAADGNGNVELCFCLFISNLMWCPCCAGVAEGRCEGRQTDSSFWHFSFFVSPFLSVIVSHRVRWDLSLCILHRGATDDQTWAWESGTVALHDGGSCLLPPPSLPSSLVIRDVWKTFLSAAGENPEIRWAVGRLLGLLQGTESS